VALVAEVRPQVLAVLVAQHPKLLAELAARHPELLAELAGLPAPWAVLVAQHPELLAELAGLPAPWAVLAAQHPELLVVVPLVLLVPVVQVLLSAAAVLQLWVGHLVLRVARVAMRMMMMMMMDQAHLVWAAVALLLVSVREGPAVAGPHEG
jgi:hypothetical protein